MPLKKELGFLDVFCVASGAMISSGLFILPGLAFARVGPGVFISYLLASLLLLPSLLCHAELVTAMPRAGGAYLFIDRSVGPAFGAMGGLANWASLAFKSGFALIGIGAFAQFFWPTLTTFQGQIVALGFCGLFAVVNLLGARHATRSQVFLVMVLVALLVAYTVAGFADVRAKRYAGMAPKDFNALFAVAAMVFVSFGGLTKVAGIAEEVRNPGRNLPLGMFAAYVIVSVLYAGAVFVTVGLTDASELSGSLTPLSLGGNAIWPTVGGVVMAVAALLAFLSTANAGILSASRTLMAMGRDKLLPAIVAEVHPRRGTPVVAVLITAAFTAAILFLKIELFAKTASAIIVLLYAFGILSVILLRESRVGGYAPRFRSPGYPWVHALGLLINVFLLVELGSLPLLLTAALLGAGLLWYALYARTRVSRESALVLLAKRVAALTFPDHDLEAELTEIARERDRLSGDRFDFLVRDCLVIDIPDAITRDGLFRLIAERLAPRLEMTPDEVRRLLEERETASSTIVRPGLAIPHILVEGENRFDVCLVRCRQGATFFEDAEPVRAVFVLAGSMDERNFHLRALMAVAQIAQNRKFEKKWRRARDAEDLRRFVLEAERKRELPEE